ncbi:GNAT family N-acetyltransferase [Brevibacillus laterosporus]|uniref:GNAT family N-acetyltransferase n=1 Tax=Brevibacillus laterosporus TaxID=1465 RepID=UPI00264F21E7|nr:GNAT family N-acetyltransferase [Brevibacillus laterosporus]MDN9010920.1 GNAT family N-acetyltransferase [Brevibacillus laterosporus]MDO0941943.1 GNAT family N-acetyltransferase [Brevibacillus laterosporus]
MVIRHVNPSDYAIVSPLINEWWGGRQMADMLPKLFFEHFTHTSFIAEKNGELIGFLIGFLSQTHADEAYIHFVGIHPEYRRNQLGKRLYEQFFQKVLESNRHVVRCVTSPVNKASIAYHLKMEFEIEQGDTKVDGIPVFADYDGKNGHRVLFVKRLT